jgi:AcrR family transcriptional regulator
MAGRPRSFDREQALAQAMEVFWSKGYSDASMAELTAAMGINAPSLYAAFGSKEQLFREAVALYQQTQGGTAWACIEGPTPVREAIKGLLLAVAESATSGDRPSGCLVVLSGAYPESLPKNVCADLVDLRRRSLDQLEQRLRRAQATGEIGPSADPAAIAAFYSTVHQGMTFRARDGAPPHELRATAEAAMLAWDGLARGARSSA